MSGCPMLQCLKGFGVKRGLSDGLYKLVIFHFIEVNPPQEGPVGGYVPRRFIPIKWGPMTFRLNSQGV